MTQFCAKDQSYLVIMKFLDGSVETTTLLSTWMSDSGRCISVSGPRTCSLTPQEPGSTTPYVKLLDPKTGDPVDIHALIKDQEAYDVVRRSRG